MKKYYYNWNDGLKLLNEMNEKIKDRGFGYVKRPAFLSVFSSSGITNAERIEKLKNIMQQDELN